MLMTGATWTHAYQRQGDPTTSLTFFLGDEDKNSNNAPLGTVGRRFSGFKLGAEYTPRDDLKLFGGLSVQRSIYDDRNPFFAKSREDWRYDMNIGVTYQLTRLWSLTPQFSYTRNDSTIPVSDFKREQLILTIRRDFF
jgi:outer membrane scaffolding protein for murein synthesis (MipA/OmpV family)